MKNEYSKIRLASSTYIMRLMKKKKIILDSLATVINSVLYFFKLFSYEYAHSQHYTINGRKVHFCGTFGNIYF